MTYSVKDVQQHYGVSQHTVLHWCATGQLKFLNVGRDLGKKRGRYRITDQALQEFELVRSGSPAPPRTRRRKRQADVVEFYK